jgi:CRP/FNR family transcriptional regulator, cyclic AMP receptor protein
VAMSTVLPTQRIATLKILIVDPRPQSRSMLKGSLLSLDIVEKVIEQGSTTNLQPILDKEHVELVILDLQLGTLPEVLDVIRALQNLPSAKKTRFILVDQQVNDDQRGLAGELGVMGFLSKPFDLQTLEQALWDGLGTPRPQGPAAAGSAGRSATAKEAGPRVSKEVLEHLRRVQIFAVFTDDELVRLLKICHFRRIPAGEYIFREGDPGDRLYILISGKVEIRLGSGNESRPLDEMSPGDCFGEMAIVDSGPRSAHAIAASDSIVIEVLQETVDRDDDVIALKLVRQLAKLLTQRIRKLVANR